MGVATFVEKKIEWGVAPLAERQQDRREGPSLFAHCLSLVSGGAETRG